MKHLSVLLKPASGHCNMRCAYCFYADVTRRRTHPSYGMMSPETARRIVDSILADLAPGDRLTLAFQGGEPTLAGIEFFRTLFSYIEARRGGILVEYALQTNGLTLDDEWCALLRQVPVLVGLSLDGAAQMHDDSRVDAEGRGTYRRVLGAKRLLDKHGIPYNVLSVLTNRAARHPQRMWRFLVREGIEYVQFIPCLGALDCGLPSPHVLEPERFYRFYSDLFPLWAELLRNGRYLSVKLFDDLVNLYGKGIPTACGIHGTCAVQFVVEGDGSVFPCDFYALDEFCLGSMAETHPSELRVCGAHFLPLGRGYEREEPCVSCRYLPGCGGGCKRMKDVMYFSGGVCWYAKLLDEILRPLLQIGRQLA